MFSASFLQQTSAYFHTKSKELSLSKLNLILKWSTQKSEMKSINFRERLYSNLEKNVALSTNEAKFISVKQSFNDTDTIFPSKLE